MRSVNDIHTAKFLKTLFRELSRQYVRGVKDFCQANPQFEPADVSRFFAGKKNWGYKKLFLLMAILKIETESIDFYSMCFMDTYIQMGRS